MGSQDGKKDRTDRRCMSARRSKLATSQKAGMSRITDNNDELG